MKRTNLSQPNVGGAVSLGNMATLHGAVLYRRAVAWSRQTSDAWDLVQDAFERALRRRPPVKSDNELRRWLLKVMKNRYLDQRRSAVVRTIVDIEVDQLPAIQEDEQRPRWWGLGTADVRSMLPRLSPRLRDTFALHLKGYAPAEIARRLNVSSATVAGRVFRARRRLERMLRGTLVAANDNDTAGCRSDRRGDTMGATLRSGCSLSLGPCDARTHA